MRATTLGLTTLLSLGLVQISDADPRGHAPDDPFVSAPGRGPRTTRTIEWNASANAPLAGTQLAGWTAMWDRDTGVPLRLWGNAPAVPGAIANPSIAEAAARHYLAANLGVLAPGASVDDFVLVSNVVRRDIRSVGFVQRAGGTPVLGGTIGFSFKHDRLSLIGSTALPHVAVSHPSTRMAPAAVGANAVAWLSDAGFTAVLEPAPVERVIVPVVRPRRGAAPDISYRLAERAIARSTTAIPGRWEVWIDAADGTPIARRNLIHFTTGKVLFDVPDRHPASTRSPKPASFGSFTADGATVTAAVDGTITWSAAGSTSLGLRARGPFIQVNNAAGSAITGTATLAANGTYTWSQASSETGDAQLSAFVHAAIVKQYAKTKLDPSLPWLDDTLQVYVNEGNTCNAYSTGDDIHFYRRGGGCENTARLADVVYHEFGHSIHAHAIIDGVGQWNGALSEGISDILAMMLTGDSGMGRGFFLSNPSSAMRELNPATDKVWPDDVVGQVHADGEIIGQTFWDLRANLEAIHGPTTALSLLEPMYYSVISRASDIPSSYPEALLGDDDDGDIANGTPNQCAIHEAFARHGLAEGDAPAPSVSKPTRDGFEISLDVSQPSTSCPGPAVQSVVVDWHVRGETADQQVALSQMGDTFSGAIPTQPEKTVVQYKVTITLASGGTVVYPNNPADPYYEFYVGYVENLWCADFESGATDWTHGGTPAAADEWEAGPALGLSSDPPQAFAGSGIFGLDLSTNGAYAANAMMFAESPAIDLQGKTEVRLHYWRWLGVEDGFYDDARLLVNGTEVFTNFASTSDPQNDGVHHLDREWRFVDVDLAPFAADGSVTFRFELETDQGLQFGGWTMDEVCVVFPSAAAPPTCGNGTVEGFETCDDGNILDGDGCSSTCTDEGGGGGGGGDDDGGDPAAGCCSTGTSPAGPIALSVLALGVVMRRRRRG